MNTIKIEQELNKLVFRFHENAPFNAELLTDADHSFQVLTPAKKVYVDLYGAVPIELLAYLLEVSNHCNLTIDVFDDEDACLFMNQIKTQKSLNVTIQKK